MGFICSGACKFGGGALSAVYTETMEEIGFQIPMNIKARDFKYVTSFRDQRKLSDTFIENQFYDLFVLNLNISLPEINIQLDEVQAVDFKNPFEIKEMVKKGLFHPRVQWVDIIYKFLTNRF